MRGTTDIEEAHDPDVLSSYAGLIFTTAQKLRQPHPRHGPAVRMEQEDIEQVLWLKVFRALQAFRPERIRRKGESRTEARDRYVFMCLTDQGKDLRKKKYLDALHIEDLAPPAAGDAEPRPGVQSRDRFEQRYLSSSHDETYGAVEDDDLLLPSTLDRTERAVVLWLYREYKQAEVARILDLGKREMERLMKSIRLKLADWRPAVDRPQLVLLHGGDEVVLARAPQRHAA